MATYFSTLRIGPWEPQFEWVSTVEKTADQINRYHPEDYPEKVAITQEHIIGLGTYFIGGIEKRAQRGILQPPEITSSYLKTLHGELFSEMREYAACWRPGRVQVKQHHPPGPEELDKLMTQLEMLYEDREINIEMLKDWYSDFETIHPFHNGNGRVGGVIVAAYSHHLYPEKGWLAPLQ